MVRTNAPLLSRQWCYGRDPLGPIRGRLPARRTSNVPIDDASRVSDIAVDAEQPSPGMFVSFQGLNRLVNGSLIHGNPPRSFDHNRGRAPFCQSSIFVERAIALETDLVAARLKGGIRPRRKEHDSKRSRQPGISRYNA